MTRSTKKSEKARSTKKVVPSANHWLLVVLGFILESTVPGKVRRYETGKNQRRGEGGSGSAADCGVQDKV